MRNNKISEKRNIITAELKVNRNLGYLVAALLIIYIAHHVLFDAETLGHDDRYTIYIFILPTLAGMIFLGIVRRKFLLRKYLHYKDAGGKLLVICFYLLQGLFFSYFSFGQAAHIIWNSANKSISEENPTEIIICDVSEFYTKKSGNVSFIYNDQLETFAVSSKMNRENHNRDPRDYKLEISAKKGIWSYYVVQKWSLKRT